VGILYAGVEQSLERPDPMGKLGKQRCLGLIKLRDWCPLDDTYLIGPKGHLHFNE
jgi:hypothetical protein